MIPKKSKILNRSGRREVYHRHEEPSPALGVVVGSHHGDGLSQLSVVLNSEEQERQVVFVEHSERDSHQQEGVNYTLC